MARLIKSLAATLFATSTGMGAIALGRQDTWLPALIEWNCEVPLPTIPDFLESTLAAWPWDWLVAGVFPCALGLLVAQSRYWGASMFWLVVMGISVWLRYGAFEASYKPWGFCGLRRDHVVDLFVLEFLVAVPATLLIGITFWIRRKFRPKREAI